MVKEKIDINEVIYELLNELGLAISNENYIILQSGESIKFNGKDIRFSYEDRFIIDGKKEIWFDPINNSELIQNLYNQYVVDHYENEGIKILSTKVMRDNNSYKNKLCVNFIDENDSTKGQMVTDFYTNINIGYIQIMLINVMVVTHLDNN